MAHNVRELIKDIQKKQHEITLPDASVLFRESTKSFAGYSDLSEIAYLGSGHHGNAYVIHHGKVLKITDDISEAEACSKIRGRRLSNVVRVYNVAVIKGGIPTRWAILEDYIPTGLNAEETDIIDSISTVMYTWAQSTGKDLREINWLDRSNIVHFSSYFERYRQRLIDNPLTEQIMISLFRGLRALAKSGISYGDIHEGNIRKDSAGNYILFDLGFSYTDSPSRMDVIESVKKIHLVEVK